MKRPRTETLYGAVSVPPGELARRLNDYLVRELDGYFSTYYSRLDLPADGSGFEMREQSMDLDGEEDLARRLSANNGGIWCVEVNFDFYAADVYVGVFRDPPENGPTTTFLMFDSELTEYLEGYDAPRVPFVLALIHMADLIGANWFLTGWEFQPRRALSASEVVAGTRSARRILAIGWRDEALDEKALLARLELGPDDVKQNLGDYRFLTFF